jgi:pimeloyl-ACP methyl ester carboxylesterase
MTDIESRVEHRYADNAGVKIHYAFAGSGPLVVMMHGFPDYWYSWRHQMAALAPGFRVAALDMRGYNLSDKPKGAESYKTRHLIADAAAVIAAEGEKRAIVAGHDWGGNTAWSLAMHRPELAERLIVLNMPHPYTLARLLAENPEQRKNSQYARNCQDPEFYKQIDVERLSAWVTDPKARDRYREAMKRSDPQAMLHYYQANYPREPYAAPQHEPKPVRVPTLLIHGLDDETLLADGLSGVWNYVAADLTIITIPGAGHFVQQDAAELVSRTMLAWLNR